MHKVRAIKDVETQWKNTQALPAVFQATSATTSLKRVENSTTESQLH